MTTDDFTYEYYQLCNVCRYTIPCFLIEADEQEPCPYCGGLDVGQVQRSALCSLEAYLRDT